LIGQRIYKSTFEAGHFIEGHPKCGTQHGHSYHLNVYVTADLDEWQDFADLKRDVDNHVQTKYDHQFLGNMSAEELASKIAKHLVSIGYGGHLELYETDKFGIMVTFQR
jgi:6-pyruvoyl-tetrahydropterin synthase